MMNSLFGSVTKAASNSSNLIKPMAQCDDGSMRTDQNEITDHVRVCSMPTDNGPIKIQDFMSSLNSHSVLTIIHCIAHIVVGTPGRVLDHMSRGTLNLTNLWCVVLDEADRMLDIGFRPDIEKILTYSEPQIHNEWDPNQDRLKKIYGDDGVSVAPRR